MHSNSSWRISSNLHTVNQTLVGVTIGGVGATCAYLFEMSRLESLLTTSPYLKNLIDRPMQSTISTTNMATATSTATTATITTSGLMTGGKWLQTMISFVGFVVIFKSEIKYVFNIIMKRKTTTKIKLQ